MSDRFGEPPARPLRLTLMERPSEELSPPTHLLASTQPAVAASPASACLDENQLAAILDGGIGGPEAAGIHAHLAECSACVALIAAAARGTAAPAAAPAPPLRGSTPPEPPPGLVEPQVARLGRYVLLDVLGQGGMGIVYSAYDPKLDRKVALKLLKKAVASATKERRARILREAQTMARLRHPNIVSVYDIESSGENVFVVQELVEGSTLRSWLADKKPSWQQIVWAFRQAGQGLAAAHHRGVVHRDFKPDNVLLGSDGRVLVSDFGLARSMLSAQDASDSEPDSTAVPTSPELTPIGALLGTPAYMSPEQLGGQPAQAASDLFSFCVSLHEALHGTRPFLGSSPLEVRAAILSAKLDSAAPTAGIPTWLDATVRRGLGADPAARWPSMDALLAALAKDPAVRRRRVGWGLAIFLLIVGVGLGLARAVRTPPPLCRGAEHHLSGVWDGSRKQAIRRAFIAAGQAAGKPWAGAVFDNIAAVLDQYATGWALMRTRACEATRITGEQSEALLALRMQCLDLRLAELRGLSNLLTEPDAAFIDDAPKAVRSLSRLDGCAEAAALTAPAPLPHDEQARQKIAQLRIELAEARALMAAGRYRDGAARATALTAAAAALGYRPLDAEALQLAGEYLDKTGDFGRAAESYRQALYAAEESGDQRRAAAAWVELVWVVGHQQGNPELGQEYARVAAASLKGLPAPDSELGMRLAGNQGAVLYDIGRREEGAAEYRRAMQLAISLYGPEHPTVAQLGSNTAVGLSWTGRVDESLALFERALSIYGRSFGPHHPHYAHTLSNIAATLLELGRLEEARMQAEQARAIIIESLGPEHIYVATVENVLGMVSFRQRRWDESRRHCQRAVELAERLRGSDHPHVANYLVNLGAALLYSRRDEEAAAIANRAAVIARKHQDKQTLARALVILGESLLRRRRARQALPILEEAVRLNESPEVKAADRGDGRFLLAVALWEAGDDRPRARALGSAAIDALESGGASARERLQQAQRWLADPAHRW